jgi:uncharacterized protein
VKPIFVDTGAFVAMVNPGDQFQKAAEEVWMELAMGMRPLISSDHVLDEVATAICRSQSPARAAQWVRLQWGAGLVRWIQPREEDLVLSADWLEKYSDQRINFTDALSFVLMSREKTEEVFTFDRHFTLAGFLAIPD